MTEWQMMVFLSRYWPGFQPIPAGSIYTYRDQGNRIATEYVDGTAGRDNIYLGNMLVASFVSSPLSGTPGWQFYASDHLGSPRFATDIGANVVENRKYWPYGEEAPSSPTSQRLQFSAMERDVEANNYNDHARHHDFNLGRFLSPDLLSGVPGDPQSWNRYSYVLNNPMRYTDPFGLFPEDDSHVPKPPPDEECRERASDCKDPKPTITHEEHITVKPKPTDPTEFETAQAEYAQAIFTRTANLTEGPVNALGYGALGFSTLGFGATAAGTYGGASSLLYFPKGGNIVLGRFGALLPVLQKVASEVNGRVLTKPIPRDLLQKALEWEIDLAQKIYFNRFGVTPDSISGRIELPYILSRQDLFEKTRFLLRGP